MDVIWHKVWFDLWHSKTRTLLVILSICVGVFAIGMIFGMGDLLLPTMDAAHQATTPSHMTMIFGAPIDRDSVLSLRKMPGVSDVEPLNTVNIRYKRKPEDKWAKGSILMRDDYNRQTLDVLQLKDGHWPLADELGIERMHSPWYRIGIGDEVIVEVDGKERTFPVAGKIRHPFVPPPSMYDLAWFFTDPEIMERLGIPAGSFNQALVRVSPYSEDYAKQVATDIKERLAKQGITVVGTLYQDPAKHWGRPFVEGMDVVLKVLAVVSLLLSVVLVMNTLMAIVTQQTNQIGILKAVGGTSGVVARVYLSGVVFYGLLALFVALPLGVWVAFTVSSAFLGLFNIDYDAFVFSTRAVSLQFFAALVVPLGAALLPVLQGAALTVRQATASYGLGGDFGSTWVDRAVERVGQRLLASQYALALANVFRRKGRLILTETVLIIAGVLFLMVMSLSSSATATLDAEFGRRSYDLIVYFENQQRIERAVAMAESVEGVEKATMWFSHPVTILRDGKKSKDAGVGSSLQGVPLNDPMYKPLIVEGRWLEPGDKRAILMNKQTAEDEHINVGDVITLDMGELGKSDWQVVGLYKVFLFFGGGFSTDAIYTSRDSAFDAVSRNKSNLLLVRMSVHGENDVKAVNEKLENYFTSVNVKLYGTYSTVQERKTADSAFGTVIPMLLMLAVLVALVGGIGLMGSLSIGVIERTKEIGVLRAIGARSSVIMRMFMLEGVTQGLLSWLIAMPISWVTAKPLADALGQAMFQSKLDFQYNGEAALEWLAIVLIIATLASILPARNATRVSVRQSLAYE